jgi:hypothetical protein
MSDCSTIAMAKSRGPARYLDISSGGARLSVFTDPSAIPEALTLLLSPSAAVRRAGIGVQFLKPEDC